MEKLKRFITLKKHPNIQEGILLSVLVLTFITLMIRNLLPLLLLGYFFAGMWITHLYHMNVHKKEEIDLRKYEKRLTETQNVLLDLISYTTKKSGD